MIKLAMEIPVGYLEEFYRQVDLDFVLAHKVLEDSEYAKWHRHRSVNRELILDNSFHELGVPLPISDLRRAAELVQADYVIAPDKLDDPDWTLKQFGPTLEALSPKFKVGIVLLGESAEDRQRFMNEVWLADMLCLPYRKPRFDWAQELGDELLLWDRIHLLGMSSVEELRAWTEFEKRLREGQSVSFDTSKPIKWGIALRDISDGQSLRHAPTSSKDLLDIRSLSEAQLRTCHRNVGFIRSLLQ